MNEMAHTVGLPSAQNLYEKVDRYFRISYLEKLSPTFFQDIVKKYLISYSDKNNTHINLLTKLTSFKNELEQKINQLKMIIEIETHLHLPNQLYPVY